MKRNTITPRSGWEKKVEEAGLVFHSPDQTYWNEAAYYSFTSAEVDMLEKTTNDLHAMCLDAVQFVIDHNRFADLKIPDLAVPVIKRAWEAEPPAIYGRFDLAYDGKNPPKLLEYNADTPTSLLEAAVVQWYWLQDVFPKADQFNSIHERLIAKWKELKDYLKMPLYLTNMDTTEDTMTVAYMRDTAEQAGLTCKSILIEEIGWDQEQNYFVDLELNPIRSVFKLYPWEWLLADEFGEHTLMTYGETQWVEPIWKMVLANKGILAILWEMHPNHPNLLETYFDSARWMSTYAKKPLLAREGGNITLTTAKGTVGPTDGTYGEEGYVFQALAELPNMDGNYPVIGSWMIEQEAGGMGIRESDGPITTNLSRFVPHLFE